MRISWRRAALLLPGIVLACSVDRESNDANSPNETRTTSSASSNGGGGCGGGTIGGDSPGNVRGAPDDDDPRKGRPGDPAPTGQRWKPIETDEGCGRMGLEWILVDEVCDEGDGNDDPATLHAPMFRDGAMVNGHLFAVDATHLWTIDLAELEQGTSALARASLLTGLGTPLAADKRGNEVVLAAGSAGLVFVDATQPEAPRRSRSLELAGKAYDVQVGGDKAYVALGRAGIAEVDLAVAQPSVTRSWPLGGFSAGIAARGGHAFVAACTTFKVVELATGKVLSQAWLPGTKNVTTLAKKVTLVGDVAFVAAGRAGAVAIDIEDPLKPSVIGNCTIADNPSFYASGVRASGDKLYVAGGEWGVLPVDVSNPGGACPTLKMAALPPKPADLSCSAKPPWEEIPWVETWAPPPPRKDPVQTLPVGDRLYAFGDARRIGVRAVDVRDTRSSELPLLARFDEPRMLLGVAATATRVVAAGPRGGVFEIDAGAKLTRVTTPGDLALRESSAVAILDDGRWSALGEGKLFVEGKAQPILLPSARAIASAGTNRIAVTTANGVQLLDVDSGATESFTLVNAAHLPLSVAADASGVYYAAPEWRSAARIAGAKNEPVAAHEIFDQDDILDATLWRIRLPRRHLAATKRGLVELAGVGPVAGLVVHGGSAKKKVTMPALTYVALASDGDRAWVAGIDRSLYKSYLVSVDISGATPNVLSVEAFTGAVSGLAVSGRHVFLADADGVIRVYDIAASGVADLASVAEVAK